MLLLAAVGVAAVVLGGSENVSSAPVATGSTGSSDEVDVTTEDVDETPEPDRPDDAVPQEDPDVELDGSDADDDETAVDGLPEIDGPGAGSDDVAEASRVFAGFLTASDAYLAGDDAPSLAGHVGGALLEELEAMRLELDTSDMRQLGSTRIRALTVVDDADVSLPETVDLVLLACVDDGDVELAYSSGDPVKTSAERKTRQTQQFFGLENGADGWRVIARSFPDDPDC